MCVYIYVYIYIYIYAEKQGKTKLKYKSRDIPARDTDTGRDQAFFTATTIILLASDPYFEKIEYFVCVSSLSLLGNGSVKIPLSLLGNGSVETLPL
jgi:hypothetical protein